MASNLTKTKPSLTPRSSAKSPSKALQATGKRPSNRPTNIVMLHQGNYSGGSDSSQGGHSSPALTRAKRSSNKSRAAAAPEWDDDVLTAADAMPRSAPAKSFLASEPWDMPVATPPANQEKLTWQQTLFSSTSSSSARPASASRTAHKRQDSAVDMTPDRPVSTGALTWQQQLLAAAPSAPHASPSKRAALKARRPRTDSGSDSAKEGATDLLSLEPLSIDDLFSSTTKATRSAPVSTAAAKQQQPRAPPQSAASTPKRPSSAAAAPILLSRPRDASTASLPVSTMASTPTPMATAAAAARESKYAGPEFHNSPSASSLPTPTFLRSVKSSS